MDDERTHGAAAADDDRRRFHRIGVEPMIAFPALAGGGTEDVAARNGHARVPLGPFGEGSVG